MNKTVRDNILFLIIAHLCWLSEPAIVQAQNGTYNPINFTQPLSVSRGNLFPIGRDAIYLNEAERCKFLTEKMGWERESCRSIDELVMNMGQINTLVVSVPESDGYVRLDDFEGSGASAEIDGITASYKKSIKDQSEALGVPIEFLGWRLHPQVDRKKNIMYFANMLRWNGDNTLNISVVMFDRYGYVTMKVVPANSEMDGERIKAIVNKAVASYKPHADSSYLAFESGDKVATYGALSVFAGILGVKYGKVVGTGLLALALVFLKKAWFLLLLPFVWIGTFFTRKR